MAGWGLDLLREAIVRRSGRPWTGLKRAALSLSLLLVLVLLALMVWPGPLTDILGRFFTASFDRPWSSHLHNLGRFVVLALLSSLLLAFWFDGKLKASWGAAGLILAPDRRSVPGKLGPV